MLAALRYALRSGCASPFLTVALNRERGRDDSPLDAPKVSLRGQVSPYPPPPCEAWPPLRSAPFPAALIEHHRAFPIFQHAFFG
jgi:hypothetical protein